MLDTFRIFLCADDTFHIFRENFRKPEGYIGLCSSFRVNEPINSLDDDHNLLINLLSTENNLLPANFLTDRIQPVSKKSSDVLFQQIHILSQLQWLFQFDYDPVQWIEVVGIAAAIGCKMHNSQKSSFFLVFALPARQESFKPTTRVSFEDEGPVLALFLSKPRVNFDDDFLLTGHEFDLLVTVEHSLRWAE